MSFCFYLKNSINLRQMSSFIVDVGKQSIMMKIYVFFLGKKSEN